MQLGLALKGQRKYAVTQEIYIMKRKPFQQLPSTIICMAGSELVLIIQRKYTIGHRCETVLHLPAKSNTQHDTKSNKGALFYLHTVMRCYNIFVMLRSAWLWISPLQLFKANIILLRNLLLIEDRQNSFFAKNKPFRTKPCLSNFRFPWITRRSIEGANTCMQLNFNFWPTLIKCASLKYSVRIWSRLLNLDVAQKI